MSAKRLSPIKRANNKPLNFSVIDIETMKWTKFIVLGATPDGKKYLEFRKLESFLDFIRDNDWPENIVAHFGGKFDFLFLLEELLGRKDVKVNQIIPRGSSILYIDFTIADKKFTLRDSSALLPFGLKSITENFNVETKKGDWDHTKTKGYSKGLSEYLRSDVMGLYQSLEKFFNWPLVKFAGPSWTMAGQAIRVFRTFLKEDLYAQSKFNTTICRKAYLGGRTEIFRPLCSKGPLYEFDVNSLYPFVMKENYFPTDNGVLKFYFDRKNLGIYEATVTAPKNCHLPVLGIVHDKKYVFPVGTFKGSWTTTELLYAESKGYKIEVEKGIVFKNKKKLFSDFIDALYKIRLESTKNSVSDIIAKLLMNSSYGRYGMNLNKENIGFELKKGVTEYCDLKVGNKIIKLFKEPVELDSFTHVAIAAHVTSYARIHMHKLMSKIKPDDLYYTDTDSIFTTKMLKHGPKLGQLKHEATYNNAIFLLPKTYIATGLNKNKIAMKGFDKKKLNKFTFEDFQNALEGDLKRFKIENEPKFATLKQALAKQKIVTMTKASEKQLKAQYDKRIIYKIKNEFYSKPITLEE